ncbi:MAG: hypothetical protein JZU53_07190 [Paludibacter sp.]|nr:hypothetical protein [Paludibacter sp.]
MIEKNKYNGNISIVDDIATKPYIDEKEAAKLAVCCIRVLQGARADREITYYKRGRKILYTPNDVLDWNKRKLEITPAIIKPKNRRRK